MERINSFDPLHGGRRKTSLGDRVRNRHAIQEQQLTDGYEQLTELCRLGEPNLAQQLLSQHPHWPYTIVDGQVQPKP